MAIMAAILKLFFFHLFSWTKGPVDLKIGKKDWDDL